MAIRITHGDVGTFAKFGIEAGKGEQRVRQAAEAEITARQQMAIDAQATSDAIRASTDISKTVINAQARQDAERFQSFMQGESAKRAIAWEQEKFELGNLHDFDMAEQRKEIENQLTISADMRQKSKMDSKRQALDDAYERRDITEKQLTDELLRMELELPASQSLLFKKGKDEGDILYADLLAERGAPSAAAPEQANSAALQKIAALKTTSAEDRIDAEAVLAEGDRAKIKITLDILEAKQEIRKGPNLLKSLSPVGFALQLNKLRKLRKTVVISAETSRESTVPDLPMFAAHPLPKLGSF